MVLTSDGPVAEGYTGVRKRGVDTAVEKQDRLHLGSCTKAMTGTLIARYIEEDKLAWDTTIASVFPDLADEMKPAWRDVTLAQLLSHTAGAPHDLRGFRPLGVAVSTGQAPLRDLRRRVVQDITSEDPAFEPGTSWTYSNWGFVIAGAMLEERTDTLWETLVAERLFEPLGMADTGFGPPHRPYALGPDADPPASLPGPCGHSGKGAPTPGIDNPATIGPAGTVHAPLADWAEFVRLHLRGARGDEGLLLSPETFAFLHQPQPGSQGTYGAGWMTFRRQWSQGPVLAHNGSNTLWFAWVWIAPHEDFAVLVVTNQGGEAAGKGADEAAFALITEHLARTSEGTHAGEGD